MDGLTLRTQLQYALRELSNSEFLDEKTSYDFLYEAALELNRITQALNGTQSITTTASTSAYNLNPDFQCLRVMNDRNERVVKFDDGNSESWISERPYESVLYDNNSDETATPVSISITDYETSATNLTGTAGATDAVSTNDTTLSGSSFGSVAVGDLVHNTTDGSQGIVTAVTSATSLETRLFYGTNNYWTSGDSYVIVPQGRKRLVVDPPNSTAGYTITVPYVQKPTPVYSPYRSYRFDSSFGPALVKYAAWLYKYRDQEPNKGDAWFKYFMQQAKGAVGATNKAYDRSRFRVNFVRRSFGDRSYR